MSNAITVRRLITAIASQDSIARPVTTTVIFRAMCQRRQVTKGTCLPWGKAFELGVETYYVSYIFQHAAVRLSSFVSSNSLHIVAVNSHLPGSDSYGAFPQWQDRRRRGMGLEVE